MLQEKRDVEIIPEITPTITPEFEKVKPKATNVHKKDPELSFKEKMRRKRDKYRTLVKGIFRFYEAPGGVLEFVYNEFEGDPVERYSLTDGHYAELPLGVAIHLNKNGWYPQHRQLLDENGKPATDVGKKIYRFGFQSLDFMDETGFDKQRNVIQSPDILY